MQGVLKFPGILHLHTTDSDVVAAFSPYVFSLHTDKATNPLNKETDWDTIKGFCDQLNNEPDGWDNDD